MTIGDKDEILVRHILDAIASIHEFVKDLTVQEFLSNDLVISAVIKKFEIIGEASNKLSRDFKTKHNRVPWSDIIGMRNILIHDYVGTDFESIWNTVKEDLPKLEAELKE